jgi:hypothetical protein
MLVAICLISLLISIPGFIKKAGYSFFKGLIPFYNIYLFFSIIEFPPVLLMLLALGLIFLPDRMFIATLLCVLLPFLVNDAFGKGKISSLFTVVLPFVMYPYLGYLSGVYCYDVSEGKHMFFKKNKFWLVLIVVFSLYMYTNFTILVDGNKLIKKDDLHYVNEIYMSDGRIYNEFLSDKEKKMYRFMLDNTRKYKSNLEIDFNEFQCVDYNDCGNLIGRAHDAILVDHPELINYAGYSWSYRSDRGFKLKLQFAVSNPIAATIGEMKIQRIIDNIKDDTEKMTDKEKIRYVYEWIGENNSYDKMFTYMSKNQSIYNVFMKNNAVCAGFAKASQVIFQNIGINSYTITGTSTGPHMWNVVEVDGKYYFYDSTVATSAKDESASWYYDGLKQEYMSTYTVDFPAWYPEIQKDNGIYIEG